MVIPNMPNSNKHRKLSFAECYVNQTILYWLVPGRIPNHCEGTTKCLKEIEKNAHSRTRDYLLGLIDYEYNDGIRKYLDRVLNKHKCSIECENEIIKIYQCENTIQLLVFSKPPEDLLADKDPYYREFFRNAKNLRQFKRNARKYLDASYRDLCSNKNNIREHVLGGLCLLYSLTRELVKNCVFSSK